ncbi:MAG: response regulator transcription factor, partial [Bacteroidales bacterium]|nr:response regulator transcription factor [Bacteroidales bacterium]
MIKIVIIEDLPMMLEGLKLIISRVKDFQIVAEYHNGKEFIDNIHNYNADIVLTDIDMPVMDGIEATSLAVSLIPKIKVIALTMYNDRKF